MMVLLRDLLEARPNGALSKWRATLTAEIPSISVPNWEKTAGWLTLLADVYLSEPKPKDVDQIPNETFRP
jgi:hypothetical protein